MIDVGKYTYVLFFWKKNKCWCQDCKNCIIAAI